MKQMIGKVALVTGASRGVGKGIALELADAGATVYITGRTAEDMKYLSDKGTALVCDHRHDQQVEKVFHQISDERERLDLLVNNVWGGYENMIEDGEFTWPRPFWQQPVWRWDAMFQAGVRAHYVASRMAAEMMVRQQSGVIVNISYWAAQKYLGNVAYGVSKAATDKMTADMSHELHDYNVAVVSLYPGLVRTEKVMESAAWLYLSNSESPQFIGRAVIALATDSHVMQKSGKVLIAATIAEEVGFSDIDGKRPRPLTLDEA
ncbi:MAG: SDR family NAD(P)-dependent oxidoreductase [bacterium]